MDALTIRRRGAALLVPFALGLTLATSARAACGDVDDNGTVGVTDGVAVLRAAAGLAECPSSVCDVDGSGAVSVTDGVQVLRAAAGLEVTFACSTTELSAQERQVFGALRKTVQLTTIVEMGVVAAGIGAAEANGAATIACPDGGAVTSTTDGVAYDACRVRDTVCSGPGAVAGNAFAPDLDCTDVAAGQSLALTADVTVSATPSGPAISGGLSGSQNALPFELAYDDFTLDENELGGRSTGGVDIEGAFFSGFFQTVRVTFPGHDPATGEIDPGFADILGTRAFSPTMIFVFAFRLNLETGKLTAN